MKQATNKLGLEIKKLDNLKEKIDKRYSKMLWKEIEPHTHRLEDLPKAVEILNSYYKTVSIFDLFSKLNNIKKELQNDKH